MKVKASHKYNASVDTVFALFSQPDFYVDKFEAVGGRNVEVLEFQAEGPAVRFTIKREMPASAPAMIKTIIGEWNTLIQKEDWGGDPGEEYWNEFDIEARGTPVTIKGSMMLRADGEGCVNDVELDINCPIPFLGRSVEQFVAEDSETSLAKEFEFITARLS
ncbi:MAG: DUF2505 domain-containing protein [Gammaproteobacteria bacterium]|nr:DUF2505 domain-containing protein [Gammaproteobacteria bacterium]